MCHFLWNLPFLKDSSGKTYQVVPAVFVHSVPILVLQKHMIAHVCLVIFCVLRKIIYNFAQNAKK